MDAVCGTEPPFQQAECSMGEMWREGRPGLHQQTMAGVPALQQSEKNPKLIVGRRCRLTEGYFGRQRLAQEWGKSGGSPITKAWTEYRTWCTGEAAGQV